MFFIFPQKATVVNDEPTNINQPEPLLSPPAAAPPTDMKEEVQAAMMQYLYELPLKKKKRRQVSFILWLESFSKTAVYVHACIVTVNWT